MAPIQNDPFTPLDWWILEQLIEHITQDSAHIRALANEPYLSPATVEQLYDIFSALAAAHTKTMALLAREDRPPTLTHRDDPMVRELLIRMRRYFIEHGCMVGECVAWYDIKKLYGVGQFDQEDEAWMQERTGKPFSLRGDS